MMGGPEIPRVARLALHALRDCRVIRAKADDPGYDWLFQRGYATEQTVRDLAPQYDDCMDFRPTIDGDALAAIVLK